METYQAYSGRVVSGKPLISEKAVQPENADLVVPVPNAMTFTGPYDRNQSDLNDHKQAHLEFIAAIAKIDDEPLDEEFDAILAKRVNIAREFDV